MVHLEPHALGLLCSCLPVSLARSIYSPLSPETAADSHMIGSNVVVAAVAQIMQMTHLEPLLVCTRVIVGMEEARVTVTNGRHVIQVVRVPLGPVAHGGVKQQRVVCTFRQHMVGLKGKGWSVPSGRTRQG